MPKNVPIFFSGVSVRNLSDANIFNKSFILKSLKTNWTKIVFDFSIPLPNFIKRIFPNLGIFCLRSFYVFFVNCHNFHCHNWTPANTGEQKPSESSIPTDLALGSEDLLSPGVVLNSKKNERESVIIFDLFGMSFCTIVFSGFCFLFSIVYFFLPLLISNLSHFPPSWNIVFPKPYTTLRFLYIMC